MVVHSGQTDRSEDEEHETEDPSLWEYVNVPLNGSGHHCFTADSIPKLSDTQ
jgi:hypothetical protein